MKIRLEFVISSCSNSIIDVSSGFFDFTRGKILLSTKSLGFEIDLFSHFSKIFVSQKFQKRKF